MSIQIDGLEYEDIDDYIFYNECLWEDCVKCPYCGEEQEDLEPQILYGENEDIRLTCQCCDKEFLLNTRIVYQHTSTPISDEVKNMIKGDRRWQ